MACPGTTPPTLTPPASPNPFGFVQKARDPPPTGAAGSPPRQLQGTEVTVSQPGGRG